MTNGDHAPGGCVLVACIVAHGNGIIVSPATWTKGGGVSACSLAIVTKGGGVSACSLTIWAKCGGVSASSPAIVTKGGGVSACSPAIVTKGGGVNVCSLTAGTKGSTIIPGSSGTDSGGNCISPGRAIIIVVSLNCTTIINTVVMRLGGLELGHVNGVTVGCTCGHTSNLTRKRSIGLANGNCGIGCLPGAGGQRSCALRLT